jgi:dienelactone hydrolase
MKGEIKVKEVAVKDNGMTGVLYSPSQASEKLPGIILLSGSDGGIPGENAIPKSFIEELVSHGYIVLALAYFGVDDLPSDLENIDLKYFESAIQWFQLHPDVKKDGIVIMGQSRGGELALILGTVLNTLKAIVAYAPSSMITGGFPYPNQPAWKYNNHPLTPYLGALSGIDPNLTELDDLNKSTHEKLIPIHANTEQDPFIIADLFSARNLIEHAKLAEIPVEKINCPILLFSGGKDAIWTSTYYCKSIIKRLNAHKSPVKCKHVNYEDAGHGLIASYDGPIYHPVGKFWCKLGGTPEGNKIANQESFKETIKFLSE